MPILKKGLIAGGPVPSGVTARSGRLTLLFNFQPDQFASIHTGGILPFREATAERRFLLRNNTLSVLAVKTATMLGRFDWDLSNEAEFPSQVFKHWLDGWLVGWLVG